MSQTLPKFVTLDSQKATIVFNCQGASPAILYWGARLESHSSAQMLMQLATRQEVQCALKIEAPISLSPCMGEGFTGGPGIELSGSDTTWSVGVKLAQVMQDDSQSVEFISIDEYRGIKLSHRFYLDAQSSVLKASTKLENTGTQNINVNYCAAPTIPLPDHMTKVMSFEGRWSNEFHRQTIDLFLGSLLRENRKGKTSHDNFPGVVLHAQDTNERQDECYGFHLGWSGNHRTRVELLPEQRTYMQMGELLMPSECSLKPNESYQSPDLFCSYSSMGFSDLSANFHQYVRSNIISPTISTKARPIHYNTWEGIYFDHDVSTLKGLADIVADIGAERFVLDDGWFKGRRGDYAGLGDWTVDKAIYPDGLQPLIDHVLSKGLAFGIWFEPEMVNPDSDLYRSHPEWVLQTQGNEQLNFRNQVVLDLSNKDVFDYLYHCVNDILLEYPDISYIKWDMNRDINHAGNIKGKPAISLQTKALYALIEKLKAAHPEIEIESCSSGGARIDYGVLSRTDRVWTSDSNDALDRLSIQRGCSFFFPTEIMGAHVGPRDCHITGRRVSIEMRAAVSFFGHMGLEMDPRELDEHEISCLKHIIKLHKKHRALIHSGRLERLESDGNSIDFGIVNDDQSQALFAYNSVTETKRTAPKKFRFLGLDSKRLYKVNRIWPVQMNEYSESVLSVIEDQVYSGQALIQQGMQMPISFPQTSLIFELNAVSN